MKLQVALIGLGQQASKYHLPGILSSSKAELVAVCDTNLTKVIDVVTKHNVRGYTTVDELLSKEKIDFVIIATPHDTHLSIIQKAAERKINILKEKPFAKNLEEAFKIKSIIEKYNVELMITLQRRFSTIYSRFFEYAKEIGVPSFIDIRYSIFAENPHPTWRGNKEQAGGGCILDMGYHMIDLLVWYFGMPDSIYSTFSTISQHEFDREVEDSASIIFEYGDRCAGNMQLSRFSPQKTEYVKIIGQDGVLELQKDRIELYGKNGSLKECLVAKKLSDELYSRKQIDYFVSVLSGIAKNTSDAKINLNHMRFIAACYESRLHKRAINPKEAISALQLVGGAK